MLPGFSAVAAACGMSQPQLEQRASPAEWQLDSLEVPQHISCEPSLLCRWPVLSKTACSSQAGTRISAKG